MIAPGTSHLLLAPPEFRDDSKANPLTIARAAHGRLRLYPRRARLH